MNLQIVVNHSESRSQFAVVDSDAPSDEQPCVVACFDNQPQAIFRTLPDAIREKYNETDKRQEALTDLESEFRNTVEEHVASEHATRNTAMTVDYLLNLLTCMNDGHKWHVESIATAETASEDFTCERCGYSPETIIYY